MKIKRFAVLSVFCTALSSSAIVFGAEHSVLKAGEKQFSKCATCHSLEVDKHMAGPSLAGLEDRTAGSQPGFIYSFALEESSIVWTQETLSLFLEDPQRIVPGNVMAFGGLRKAEQREALIVYLLDR
jgi:cytochrome c2